MVNISRQPVNTGQLRAFGPEGKEGHVRNDHIHKALRRLREGVHNEKPAGNRMQRRMPQDQGNRQGQAEAGTKEGQKEHPPGRA